MSDIFTNKMYGNFICEIEKSLNLSSHINIGIHGYSSLNSHIVIKPSNKMYGNFSIKAPTRQIAYLTPIQDAFVRKNAPTMNYGIGELDVGSDSTTSDVFRSYLQWDISSIQNTYYIVSAKVHFYLLQRGSYDFNVNQVNSAWSEMGITWKGQPIKGDFISEVTVSNTIDDFYVDITELTREWQSNNYINYGIELSSVNETLNSIMRLGGRETTGLEPVLEIQYFDPNGVYDEEESLISNITIMKDSFLNLNSHIVINNILSMSNLSSSIKIRIPNTLFSQIIINKPALYGHISIPTREESKITGKLVVQKKEFVDLLSNAIIKNDKIFSNISISNIANLAANISISQNFMKGKINISNIANLSSNICISNHINLSCSIRIANDNVVGRITIGNNVSLNSTISIVKIPHLRSNITISNYRQLPSNIHVSNYDNLNSHITIGTNNHLNSHIVIAKQENVPLSCHIMIQNLKILPSHITIRSNVLGKGHITIQKREELNLSSKIKITDNYPKLNSHITIRAPWYSDLGCSILIKGNETNNSDFGFIL